MGYLTSPSRNTWDCTRAIPFHWSTNLAIQEFLNRTREKWPAKRREFNNCWLQRNEPPIKLPKPGKGKLAVSSKPRKKPRPKLKPTVRKGKTVQGIRVQASRLEGRRGGQDRHGHAHEDGGDQCVHDQEQGRGHPANHEIHL